MQNCSTGKTLFYSTNSAAVINDAIGNMTSGGKLFIKAGTYTISSTGSGYLAAGGAGFGYYGITNDGKSNLEIYGEGAGATILQLSASAPKNTAVIYIYGNGLSNFAIHDLTVDGNRANRGSSSNAGWENGIYLSGTYSGCGSCYSLATSLSNVAIYNTVIENVWTYGLFAYFTTNLKIHQSTFNNIGADGINIDVSADVLVQSNTVTNTSDNGITETSSTNVTFDSNDVSNINLGVSPFGINTGLAFSSQGAGPGWQSGSGLTISNNDVNTATQGFTNIVSGGGALLDLKMIDNTFKNIVSPGPGRYAYALHIEGIQGCLIQGNTVAGDYGLGSFAVYVDDTYATTGLSIIGNQFLSVSDTVDSTPTVGVVGQSGVSIENNVFSNDYGPNIKFLGVSYSSVIANTVLNSPNSQASIVLEDIDGAGSTHNLIEGNHLYYGIYFTTNSVGSSYNTIEGNTVGGSLFGVHLDSAANNNLVTGNDFSACLPAIEVTGAEPNTFMNNTGYNPLGQIVSPFVSSGDYILDNGGGATPANATAMTVYDSPKLIKVITGNYTSAYTLVILIDGTQVINVTNPVANSVYSFQLQPGETFYCEYHTSQTAFVVSGQ